VVAQLNPNGSGRKMTDASGAVVYRAEYDPWGKLLYEWSAPANLNRRKFTGYERNAATNLDYALARMYSSEWGRFLSPDPAGLRAARMTSPKSLNRYAYTEGNPINYRDPSGLGIFGWFSSFWGWLSNPERGAFPRNLYDELPHLHEGGPIVMPMEVGDPPPKFYGIETPRQTVSNALDNMIEGCKEFFGTDFEKMKEYLNSADTLNFTIVDMRTQGNENLSVPGTAQQYWDNHGSATAGGKAVGILGY
jgi:RHS repeat-associated protein